MNHVDPGNLHECQCGASIPKSIRLCGECEVAERYERQIDELHHEIDSLRGQLAASRTLDQQLEEATKRSQFQQTLENYVAGERTKLLGERDRAIDLLKELDRVWDIHERFYFGIISDSIEWGHVIGRDLKCEFDDDWPEAWARARTFLKEFP